MNRFKKTLKYMCMLGKDLNSFRVSTYEQISVLHYFLYTLYYTDTDSCRQIYRQIHRDTDRDIYTIQIQTVADR